MLLYHINFQKTPEHTLKDADECIGICSEIMEEELNPYDDEVLNSDINLLKPEEIHVRRWSSSIWS